MKKFCISLPEREDRKRWFYDQNSDKIDYEIFKAIDGRKFDYSFLYASGFDTYKNWRDPINHTHITGGEIGCFLSHYSLWMKCVELDEPIMIFEDDANITDEWDESEINKLIEEYNFIYLGWLEMGKSKSVKKKKKLVVPEYPYWTLSYVITPEAAKILTEGNPQKEIIPVDEYLPAQLHRLNVVGYKENVVIPAGREIFGTDVDPHNRYDYFLDFRTHAVTIGDDDSKCWRLHESAHGKNFRVKNLCIGQDIKWTGSDMSGPGGGQKVNILRDYIYCLPDHDVVLFADGFDTFAISDLEEITRRFLEFKCKVLFAAEEHLWPDKDLEFPECETKYRYLNSGLFIGRVDELKRIMNAGIKNEEDDQLYYQKAYLNGDSTAPESERLDIKLDHECYVFQCHEENLKIERGTLFNNETRCYPCFYHGNGDGSAKKHFQSVFDRFFGGGIVYTQTDQYELLGPDMILVDYMSPNMCHEMIRRADEYGQWGSLSYDKFPAQEIRLKKISLWEEMAEHWQDILNPIIERFWHPMEMYGMRDAFVMRYAMNTQTNLALHNDASLVTGSVKLNDNYQGADLEFPRQKFSNKDIPVGKCILFPGQVSHGHTCTELKSGVKYSLTMWSKRFHKDEV
tara:strand:- start:1100 stop:2980 length:1881 start_codon:yes stop_codon:yes gene_type:complete